MDLEITGVMGTVRLSDLGVYRIDVDIGSPIIETDKRQVRGRSGRILGAVTFDKTVIQISGRFVSPSIASSEVMKERLKGLFLQDEPYLITKMVPISDPLYGYELPGQRTGEFQLVSDSQKLPYGYLVLASSEMAFEFLGRSSRGLLYKFKLSTTTSELPYGQTPAKTITVSGSSFSYGGTARLSQLEVPFVVELTASASMTEFYLTIDGRRFTYRWSAGLQAGDKLILTGLETRLNDRVVNNRTNYEYFVIRPKVNGLIPVETNFRGTIKLVNLIELYK